MRRLLWAVGVAAILLGSVQPALARKPGPDEAPRTGFSDNLPSPLSERQAALKLAAQQAVLTGTATATGPEQVVNLHRGRGGKYVQLAFQGEDQIFTLLGQFGDQHAQHTHGGQSVDHGGTPGPLHNQIPQPDRSVDNTTVWDDNFDQAYYQTLLYDRNHYPSMANYYFEQSSGQYTVDGYVSDWVQLQYNEASYGSDYCGDIVCADTWLFDQDLANTWWNNQVSALGEADALALLHSMDQWDRYDYDGDGNFNEPDGYIDHFQAIHAGQGEEVGGGAEGSDAIWSHRWYAFYNLIGVTGPDGYAPFGGFEIGDSNVWIGDYTVEPENGGVGVFAHEFGHDLGLPDEYDTSGNTGGAENSTGWWTNWSQGSYGTQGDNQLGMYPVSMTSWEKFQLGFMQNYRVVASTEKGKVGLGPNEYNTNRPQALIVVLPDRVYNDHVGDPHSGTNFYYSGAANNLTTTMTRDVTLPSSGDMTLHAWVQYNIEEGFDFAALIVNGNTVPTNLSNSSVVPDGIDGDSGGYVELTADLSSFAGQTVNIGFAYVTDGGVQGNGGSTPPGIAIDDILIPGQPADGAETDAGWTFDSNSGSAGFHVTTGTESSTYFNAYFIENRQYIGYDDSLRLGPYNFGFLDNPDRQNFVEHFRLQKGVLVWYWNTRYEDNNVGDHPGEGQILPVDSHPQVLVWNDGVQARPRINSYDATFTIKPTKSLTLNRNSSPTTWPSQPGVSVFNDMNTYWFASDPSDAPGGGRYQASWNSVNVPHTGFSFKVKILNYKRAVLKLNP